MMKTEKRFVALAVAAVSLSVSAVMPAGVLAADDNEACIFSYSVSFVDSSTGKNVENINARICKREYDKSSAEY